MSWGDWDYFQNPDASVWLALKAALLPTRSVVHVVAFDGPLARAYTGADIVEVELSKSGIEQLVDAILATFSTTDAASRPGLIPHSLFYPASGKFHLFNTCNNWVARMLREAGCPATPWRAITADGVLRQARSFGAVIAERP